MTGFDVRLVAHAPNGDRLGILPTPLSVEVALPLDDVGSLRLSYPLGAPGAGALAVPIEVAVETYDPTAGTWSEVDGGRFLRIKRSGDVTDPTGARSYELPAYAWMLRKARLFPSDRDNSEGKRPFLSATPGTILGTLIAEAKARGALAGLVVDFTPTVDSAGAAWSKVLTIYYEPGIDVLAVLDNLAEQGVLDWTLSGRTLRVFNADTALGRNLAEGDSPVDLRLGRDITEAPDTGTLEDVASAVYVKGEGAARLELTNPNAPAPWGRWEGFITQGGVRDPGTMRLLAEAELDRTGRERVQVTRGLTFAAAKWLPLKHYRPGDYVLAPGDAGALVPLRLRQITLTRDQAGTLGGNLVLNDRFVERELRLAKRTAGIVGGATATGGSGARPAPEGPDPREPAAPAGLIVATAAYLDSDGAARGQITATWGRVDKAVDGTLIEVARYELYQRPNIVGLPWSKLTETTHPDNSATGSPYDVGTEWAFKVRAVSKAGVFGPFSAPYAVTIAADTEAPPVPSAPRLTTRLGVIHVEWDGRGAAGEVMPADFSHLDVWMSASSDVPIWSENWPYSDNKLDPNTWSVLLSGTDPAYTVAEGKLTLTSGSDLLATRDTGARDYIVTARNLAVGTQYRAGVYARYRPGPSSKWPYRERAVYVLARRNDEGNDLALFVDSDTNSRVTPLPLPAGATIDDLTLALSVSGRTVEVLVNGVSVHTDTLTEAELAELDGTAAGIYLEWPRASVGLLTVTPKVSAEPVRVGQLEGAGTLVVAGEPYNQPRTFRLTALDRSGNTSAASEPATISTKPLVPPDLIGRPIYGDKIVANSITADQLAVGSVTASAIRANTITAEKLSADAIDGKVITGATLRTSATNPRVQLDEDGLRAWNSSGTRTVDISASTGAADIAGTLRTGTSGVRAIVDASVFGGYPGIYFTGMAGSPGFEPTVHAREDGTLWALSAEQVGNSSGRTDLIMRKGGAWTLGKQFGAINTAVKLDSPGDGRLHITGIIPTGGSSETMLFGGINGFNNASGATMSYARVNPNSNFNVVVTCASPAGPAVRWAITNHGPNSFSVGWVDTSSMLLHWLVFRNA
ncbi:hypothetical protein NLX83_10755 [Allokutzneria sp. A3M-2-11 16]|uniref:hypothetical protein n=1 Tax=Allokutzneria sp. A3M-2-11 16 TaxID=2962043 RepID=UPI0020B880C9|nr:hypothetical protein [Allokutzneria sp. A3M-2-11 16]MCP3799737.1 hypothetical protein [Allokutzneria sp. A3M-2-11 16]